MTPTTRQRIAALILAAILAAGMAVFAVSTRSSGVYNGHGTANAGDVVALSGADLSGTVDVD